MATEIALNNLHDLPYRTVGSEGTDACPKPISTGSKPLESGQIVPSTQASALYFRTQDRD
jgi:hypothetical protein